MCSGLPMSQTDAAGESFQSQVGFLPMMYSREGDRVFIKDSYPELASLGADERQQPTSPDYYNALTTQKNVWIRAEVVRSAFP